MWGRTPKLKWAVLPPPHWHFKNGGTSPEEKKLAAGANFFFHKIVGAAGFPSGFFGKGGGHFLAKEGGTKNPTPKNRRETFKEQKTPCAEGAQNFWENFGKKHLKLVFFLVKI